MSTGMSFDNEMSTRLDIQYTRPAMVLRRAHALALADPKLGEDVLDVGSGPGFLTADLAAGVGERGSVLGIDQSDAMIELATRRCARWPQVRVLLGDATDLGGEDALTHVKAALVERFVFLEAVLQKLEADIATAANGNPADLLGKWIQGVNSLQGLAQRIGLARTARQSPLGETAATRNRRHATARPVSRRSTRFRQRHHAAGRLRRSEGRYLATSRRPRDLHPARMAPVPRRTSGPPHAGRLAVG